MSKEPEVDENVLHTSLSWFLIFDKLDLAIVSNFNSKSADTKLEQQAPFLEHHFYSTIDSTILFLIRILIRIKSWRKRYSSISIIKIHYNLRLKWSI